MLALNGSEEEGEWLLAKLLSAPPLGMRLFTIGFKIVGRSTRNLGFNAALQCLNKTC